MVNVGYNDGLKPGNLVGAVANEADLDSEYIGHIEILENFSVVDLPDGMPAPVMNKLKKARVCGRPLEIRPYNESEIPEAGGTTRPVRTRSEGFSRERAPRDGGREGGSRDFAKKPARKPRADGPAPAARAPRKSREG